MQPSKTELELELNEMTFFLIAFITAVVKNLEFIHRHKKVDYYLTKQHSVIDDQVTGHL